LAKADAADDAHFSIEIARWLLIQNFGRGIATIAGA